ncbi:triose-phosphate isomerase [Candidatus Roizmanbacteria bacterium CG22_combo_CG10-13_8_21_14_all_34_12]|uniref:Triose-phosphate isomerase n=2 Tax=Candidatus Roizmaniibacteriota TaxID=1752723 RepID=A0A2H0C2D0_9BACT|nr:MAG: triose-phosphate isomerase [Candidatus Roizmanbacteria bacterium CG22_combo_CG10-13_8_21_14_all_34_12]
MIILSLKTYKESTGEVAIKLLSCVKKISEETGVKIVPAVQPTDIYRVKKELGIEVWAQHMDPIEPGKNMGWLSPYALKEAGATGVVINHSEHKMSDDMVKKTLDKAKEYRFANVIIGFNLEMIIKFDSWGPDFVSYEKEDMIGTGVSMLTQEAENIKKLVAVLKNPLIIGAGISTGEDTKQAVKLGAKGAILASGFVLAKDPEAKLRELAEGFKS